MTTSPGENEPDGDSVKGLESWSSPQSEALKIIPLVV